MTVADPSIVPLHGRGLRIERKGRVVLDVPNITVGEAPCSAIIGPNGAGKSLLLRTLAGLLSPDSGSVCWAEHAAPSPTERAGTTPKARRLGVGFVMQRPALLARSARANLVFALRARGHSAAECRERANAALHTAGLTQIADTAALRLSAGEQQRLALARALSLEPAILLLDEPTASVDPVSTAPIEQMLGQAAATGCRIVIVSHDISQVKRLADEVLMMHAGSVVEQQPVESFFAAPNNELTRRWLAGELLV